MRITHEADYAIRIVYVLMQDGKMISAREIAERSGVTLRFTLKILNKLGANLLVVSRKGNCGGYTLATGAEELSLGQIIECIDGPLELNHCLNDEFICTRVGNKNLCKVHHIFDDLNKRFKDELYSIKIVDLLKQ